jgi:hypothetical protein
MQLGFVHRFQQSWTKVLMRMNRTINDDCPYFILVHLRVSVRDLSRAERHNQIGARFMRDGFDRSIGRVRRACLWATCISISTLADEQCVHVRRVRPPQSQTMSVKEFQQCMADDSEVKERTVSTRNCTLYTQGRPRRRPTVHNNEWRAEKHRQALHRQHACLVSACRTRYQL